MKATVGKDQSAELVSKKLRRKIEKLLAKETPQMCAFLNKASDWKSGA
jgi:hypothetical protein